MMTSNFWQKVLVISGFLAVSALNLSVTQAYRSNEYVNKGGCYLQKEYNYFMNQWTTNEVCRPKFVEQSSKQENVNANYNVSNSYLYYDDRPAPVTYYTGPSLDAMHTARSTGNSWNGYGNSANYLLGSFGGGYYNSYVAPTYVAPTTYYNSWYPTYSSYLGNYGYYNTLSTYYPSYTNSYSNSYTNDYTYDVGFGFSSELAARGYSQGEIYNLAEETFGITINE